MGFWTFSRFSVRGGVVAAVSCVPTAFLSWDT